ncbi:site-2 protease family protein [Halostreptopolyspora alba]|uniref:Site-2 protease family protein n=1 Tax=Halostreptopolyspora alba TaxID=2487137 RepID=A0A3N0DRB8_9ACTN|nr:site-2 protease family protein [Nocardiopsaceae bacterium YIM 96095]
MPTPEPVEADANDSADRNGAPDPTKPEEDAAPEGADAPEPAHADGGAPSRAAEAMPSPLIVLLLGVTGLAGWLSWTRAELDWGGNPDTVYLPFVFVLSGWIVSVALHEFAHAALAYGFGDRALRGSGYLRLNPFGFRDRFANLVLPVVFCVLGGIGLTGPAGYLDHAAVGGRFRRSLVALAGPAVSLLIAAALAGVLGVLVEPEARTNNWALAGMMYLCHLNLVTALVSLLPIPGLDGFDAVSPYLPEHAARRGRALGLFGVIAVFGVLWLPYVNAAFFGLVLEVFSLAGFPQIDINFGRVVFQFWGI